MKIAGSTKCAYLWDMILITGSTGLLGAQVLLRLLETGKPLRALYRDPERLELARLMMAYYGKSLPVSQIDWVQADITDIPALTTAFEGVTEVYHCAAMISFDPSDEVRMRKANIEGTANIVNLCLAKEVRKLCHVSSIAALGDPGEGEDIVTEETDWNPEKLHSDYAISKHGGEMEVWRGAQEGLKTVIVNPGIIIGPLTGNTGTADLFTAVSNKLSFYTSGGMGVVAAADVAEIMVRLMESPIQSARFILSEKNYDYKDLIGKVAREMNVPAPKKEAHPWMTEFAWRADWLFTTLGLKKRALSKTSARSLHSRTVYPNNKIREALGFTFTPIDQAIKDAVAFAAYLRKM